MTSLSLTNLDPFAKRLTTLANKAGAALPTTKITAKTWAGVLDAALDRLEAPAAAAPEPAPAPAPAPAPVYPTPLPAYPKGVERAGLKGVFDARPGLIRPLTKLLTPLPPGWFPIVPGTYGAPAGDLTDTDAWGVEVYFNGGTAGR